MSEIITHNDWKRINEAGYQMEKIAWQEGRAFVKIIGKG